MSDAALRLLDAGGFRWAASSGSVLRASLAAASAHPDDPEAYDRPYRPGPGAMQAFFRDDRLSDLIGFTYATWHGDDAASNLVQELARIAEAHAAAGQGAAQHAVLVALDGENAWEHYPFNGYYFLDALYAALADHPSLELTTLSACVERGIEPRPLARVVAGSWVHGTLATWMGDAAKNAAWDLLCEAKSAFDEATAGAALPAERRAAAHRQLALCESSDWFWWFGDYNPPEAVRQFDELFRRQLRNLYGLLDRGAPEALSRPIAVGRGEMEHGGVMRRAFA